MDCIPSKLHTQCRTRRLVYQAAVTTVFLILLLGLLPTTSLGQLRTGESTRTFYRDTPPSHTTSTRTNDSVNTSRTAEVALASHTESTTRSIIEPPSLDQSALAPVQQLPSDSIVQPAACATCNSGDLVSNGYAPMIHEGSLGSTGDCGCDSCSGFHSDMAQLAPTCSTYCSPGGLSLLRSLWCRMSVRAEVPLYWRRAAAPPALVTTAPVGTDADLAGQLGQSTMSDLLGDSRLNEDSQAGVRLTFATWLGKSQCYGLMFRYWNAGDQNDTYSFNSNTNAILARPFFNTTVSNAFENDTQLVSFPGDTVGDISVSTTSSVQGLELTMKRLLYQDRFTRMDWVYGYQHLSIDEGITIKSNTTVTGNLAPLQGSTISIMDDFQTQNDFNGVSHALMSTRTFACWKLETLFRLGLGNLRRKVNIAGSTTTTSGATSNTTAQGLLARSTNSRPYVDDTFIIVPEVGVNLAYAIRPGLDFTVGYNYMLVPKVAQASQQIGDNLAVNLSEPMTGRLDPELNFDERNYWLHSLGLGLQLRY